MAWAGWISDPSPAPSVTSKPGLVPGFVLYGHPGGSVLSRIASARTWRGAAGLKANTNPCACPTAPVATTASRNPQPSAPSWRTSRSTVRGKKRTTGLQRAHRRRKPRDELPATQPTANPGSDSMRDRPRRAALGPLLRIVRNCPWMADERPRAAEIQRVEGSAPEPTLARPPPTRQTARKGRLKFLYPCPARSARCRMARSACAKPPPTASSAPSCRRRAATRA